MADSGTSGFLPTIKCSMCHRDIEISQMGDHVCSGGEATPPLESHDNFSKMPYKENPTQGSENLKLGRAMPPNVDINAANRPFFRPDQLTPISSSPSRSVSPMTPNDMPRSPFGRPMRSGTVNRPPSPEVLSSNLDCAFPPFPVSKPAPASNRPTREAGYGGMTLKPDDPLYAPISPRTATSGGLLQRMNTIAPGPFDMNGRRPSASTASINGHERQKSLKDVTMSSRTAEIESNIVRPKTASGHSRSSTTSSNGSRSGIPKILRKEGYGGFGRPTPNEDALQPLRPEDRAQTFPLRSGSQEPSFRKASEPDARFRRPSNDDSGRRPSVGSAGDSPPRMRRPSTSGSSGPDLSRPLPPRGASLMRPRTDIRLGNAPPVPSHLNLAAEFGIGNPYHTPSESQSSNASGYSQESPTSSRSSPPLSTGPGGPRREPADTSRLEALMSEVQSSMADLQPRQNLSSSPPKRIEQLPRGLASGKGLDPSLLFPESPIDPSIQGGQLSPIPSRNPARNQAPVSPPKPLPVRRTTASKGNCKGCGEAIKGKSVSSADGRLTGRYHKQCFVCATCSEPFQTSTFYVIDDSPYCERHYHKLNGSICQTCDRGIEGQYLETEKKQKFHSSCLTCADCKRNLRHDYFEMNGKVYCERDAFRRAQQGRFNGLGAGTNRMERRTTRLMMMM